MFAVRKNRRKDHADQGRTWRHRLWFSGGDLAGWGWIFLPYQVMRSDGQVFDMTMAALTWQVHPDSPHLLDDILDWYDAEAAHAHRRVTVRAADGDALRRLAAHGYRVDEQAAPAHPAARALYYDTGFRPFTRDLPHVKPGVAPRVG